MTATLSLAPNPITPFGNVRVTGAGFDPTKKVQLALDGSGWTTNYLRPAVDGTFHVGMNVSSRPKAQAVTARYAGTTAIVATAALTVAVSVPPPPPVDPPKPPDVPGPIPTGATPPKAVDRTGATDTTAALMTWLNGLSAGTDVDWDGGTYRIRQLLLEGRSLRFHGAGKLIFTAFMTGSAAGSIHMRNQCRDMVFDHRGPDGKPQLVMVGAAPASDYGRAHNSQEATENNHLFWLQGVQGCEIAGVIGYGAGGDTFYSGGWTAKAGQWTHDLHVHHNVFSAMGRMFGALADGGTNVLVEDNDFGVVIPGTPIDSLAKAGPGWNGVIIEPNDAPVADGSAYGYGNVIVRNNRFGRGYHPGGVSGGATSASAHGGKPSTWAAPIRWENNVSDPAFPWQFVNSYGQVVTQAGNK